MFMVTHMEHIPNDDYALAAPVYAQEAKRHQPINGQAERRLEVFVIFTDLPGTLAAIQRAEGLAEQLGAHLRLVMPYEVSYMLPLTKPPVPVEFLEGQMRDLAARTGMEVEAQVCLCRDKKSALGNLLPPNSLIVVGGRKRWWPTAAQMLARSMQRDGHQVIFADLR
jgi:hypothetical protein